MASKKKQIPKPLTFGFIPPAKMKIKSDGNVIEYVRLDDKMYVYKYTKSFTKKGMEIPLSEEQINKMLGGMASVIK